MSNDHINENEIGNGAVINRLQVVPLKDRGNSQNKKPRQSVIGERFEAEDVRIKSHDVTV